MPLSSENKRGSSFQGMIRIDHATFKTIFLVYKSRLTLFARAILKDSEMAEDAVADVFEAIWKKREGFAFSSEGELSAYLYNTTRSKSVDCLRKNGKDEELKNELSYLESGRLEDDPLYTQSEVIALLHKAIHALTPTRRKVVIRWFIEDKSYEDIAKEMDLRESSVRKEKSRAILSIQSKMIGQVLSSLIFLFTWLKH